MTAKRANLLDAARVGLAVELAEAAVKVEQIERKIERLQDEQRASGYDRILAKMNLREAVRALEAHDDRRKAGART